jgi:hypothetical protein
MFKVFWKIIFPRGSYWGRTSETVRYAFPIVMIAVLFAGLASVVTEQSSYVAISTETDSVTRDQIFFIDVRIMAHVPVNALDLVISYPEDMIEVQNIDTGRSVLTLWPKEPYAENGNIYLRGGTLRKGFIGEHPVARIKARAKEAGDAHIFIKDTRLVAGDGTGNDVTVAEIGTKNEARIKIQGDDGVISGKVAISIITDTDGDGDVDIGDITAFMNSWFTRKKTYDFNGDGRMTFSDFSILLADSFFR